MYSQTFFAHEVFRSFWSLGTLTALCLSDEVRLPFDTQLKEFLAERKPSRKRVLIAVQMFSCLEHSVIERESTYTQWNGVEKETSIFDAERLTADVICASDLNSWYDFDFSDRQTYLSVVKAGIEHQVIHLILSAIEARFCFGRPKPRNGELVADVIDATESFISPHEPFAPGDFHNEVLLAIYREHITKKNEDRFGNEFVEWFGPIQDWLDRG